MEDMELTTAASVEVAHTRLVALLHAGDNEDAIAFVQALSCHPSFRGKWTELLAIAYTEGGAASGRRDWIEHGADLWRELGPRDSAHIAYNLANAELALWETGVREDSIVSAWEHNRSHLSEARALYECVGSDETLSDSLRLKALTNAANSYDVVGRNLDAIALYNQALAIDKTFAMALGNRGLALKYFAPFMGTHAPHVLAQAATDLNDAIQNTRSLRRHGIPQAAEHFRRELDGLPNDIPVPPGTAPRWEDPYLQWCHRHELFLHVWPQGLSEDTQCLDPLFFAGLRTPMSEEGLTRLHNLTDAFNVLKQDYVAVRYSMWLANDPDSTIGSHSADMSARTLFVDTVQCARWGVRTGMMMQALAAATNILDKVAGFVHLYLGTGRVKNVYFSKIDRPDKKRAIDAPLRAAIERPEQNIGLLALLDLSHDLDRGTPFGQRVSRRHMATHRFVVAHNIMVPEPHEWVDRVDWLDLTEESIHQLRTARAALIYLARLIDRHERVNRAGSTQKSVDVPMKPVDTRSAELL